MGAQFEHPFLLSASRLLINLAQTPAILIVVCKCAFVSSVQRAFVSSVQRGESFDYFF